MLALDRRHFCTLSTFAVLAAPHGLVSAGPLQERLDGALVLYREHNRASREFAARLAAEGRQTRALEADLVRQWRDSLAAHLDQGGVLMGQSDWDDWLLLRGLAAEQRRFPLYEAQQGASLFSWILG